MLYAILMLTWIISLAMAFGIGYSIKGIRDIVIEVQDSVKSKVDKKIEEPEPVSELIDLTDPIQTAIYEHKVMMDNLNGKSNTNN